jgi:hypothetical protein
VLACAAADANTLTGKLCSQRTGSPSRYACAAAPTQGSVHRRRPVERHTKPTVTGPRAGWESAGKYRTGRPDAACRALCPAAGWAHAGRVEHRDREATAARIQAARARAAQAAERIAQIHLRIGQLRNGGRSTGAQRQSAVNEAEHARTHAEEAARFSVQAYLAAAAAHDRVAEFHEFADREDHNKTDAHRLQAALHRERAEDDRRSAESVRGGTCSSPPARGRVRTDTGTSLAPSPCDEPAETATSPPSRGQGRRYDRQGSNP